MKILNWLFQDRLVIYGDGMAILPKQEEIDMKYMDSLFRFQEDWEKSKQMFGNFGTWKIASMALGVKNPQGIIDPLNPSGIKRGGYSAAMNLLMDGKPVKIPMQGSMIGAGYSPLVFEGNLIINEVNREAVSAFMSDWERPNISYLLPTLSGTVSLMAFSGCSLFDYKSECEFCIVGPAEGKAPVSADAILAEIDQLYRSGYEIDNIVMNTGQPLIPGEDLRLIGRLAGAIKREYPGIPLAAEIGPFSFLGNRDLREIVESTGLNNLDAVMMNVELTNDQARKRLSPSKPLASAYLEILGGLVELGFGATSLVQLNYYLDEEPIESVSNFVNEAGALGIKPELVISRWVPGSKGGSDYFRMLSSGLKSEAQPAMFERYSRLLDRLDNLRQKINPDYLNNQGLAAGCLRCSMCSINDVLR